MDYYDLRFKIRVFLVAKEPERLELRFESILQAHNVRSTISYSQRIGTLGGWSVRRGPVVYIFRSKEAAQQLPHHLRKEARAGAEPESTTVTASENTENDSASSPELLPTQLPKEK